jgi:hypothetical protein
MKESRGGPTLGLDRQVKCDLRGTRTALEFPALTEEQDAEYSYAATAGKS